VNVAQEPDIFALLDIVHGTESGSREAKIDNAVQTIENTHQRAFAAMRQFTETGKIVTASDTANASAAAQIAAAATAMEARMAAQGQSAPQGQQVPAPGSVPTPSASEEPTHAIGNPLDPEQTEVIRRPGKPAAKSAPNAPAVVSGSGADFRSGLTKTNIVRPKKWFSK
jgi:hypothetical protein